MDEEESVHSWCSTLNRGASESGLNQRTGCSLTLKQNFAATTSTHQPASFSVPATPHLPHLNSVNACSLLTVNPALVLAERGDQRLILPRYVVASFGLAIHSNCNVPTPISALLIANSSISCLLHSAQHLHIQPSIFPAPV